MAATSPELDEQFIRRAIRLAMNGRGRVEPNPMVGCVLVKDGRIIGEGYHAQFGGPHAEPTALANCTESPAGSTAYVTLEPCCHTNKKTPPCAPRLIEAKIARVVIGCLDPNPDVNGKGVAMLRAAGIEVDGPVLEGAAKQLIAPFLAGVQLKRPYVTAKWAQSADGKVAGANGKRRQISGPAANRLVHQLRATSTTMLVGVDTVLNDDPVLTVRDVPMQSRPVHIAVMDTHLRTPPAARLFNALERKVTVYCSTDASTERADVLEDAGATVRRVPTDGSGRVSIGRVLEHVGVGEVLVEPGPTLARAMLAAKVIDRIWIFRSRERINEDTAPRAAAIGIPVHKTGEIDLVTDVLDEHLSLVSPACFAWEPSADFVLAREASLTSSRP